MMAVTEQGLRRIGAAASAALHCASSTAASGVGFTIRPSGHHLKLRLQAARNHLFYGDMPIQEIATATGFSSPSVLSRSFKGRFGLSPREFRDLFARERLQRFRPEVRQQLGLGNRS
jgi:AraC-like DNA-binding protein